MRIGKVVWEGFISHDPHSAALMQERAGCFEFVSSSDFSEWWVKDMMGLLHGSRIDIDGRGMGAKKCERDGNVHFPLSCYE